MNTADILVIQKEFSEIFHFLDERRIRLWCAARARAYNRKHGRGGVTAVHQATGVSRPRISQGMKDISNPDMLDKNRIRKPGAGRKKTVELQPDILKALDDLVDPDSRGDPESPSSLDLKKYL
ncbi:hypothetical protein [Desulfonema limicola]|nr:hypothetical protein [Desulfonema limicola]